MIMANSHVLADTLNTAFIEKQQSDVMYTNFKSKQYSIVNPFKLTEIQKITLRNNEKRIALEQLKSDHADIEWEGYVINIR